MVGIGILIGIAEIIFGIIVLFNANHQAIAIGTGIGYILSGVLFIWLCVGASTAFANVKEISNLRREVKKLQEQNNTYLELFKTAGVKEEEIKLLSETCFSNMKEGHKLISLIQKTIVGTEITIPKESTLSFVRYEVGEDGSGSVVADVTIGNKTHRVRYKADDVISEQLYLKNRND